jgi:hypothetical protein
MNLVSPASGKGPFFDQRNHVGEFEEYLYRNVRACDSGIMIPDSLAIVDCFGRPHSSAAGAGHLSILVPEKISDAGLFALSGIERGNALVDFGAQGTQLLDMREQRTADLFLILGGQALQLGNGLFKRFDHDGTIPDRTGQNRGGDGR